MASKTPKISTRSKTPVVKAAAKAPVRSSRKPAAIKSSTVNDTPFTSSKTESSRSSSFRLKRSYLITAAVLLALGSLLYLFRGVFLVATVNGRPISRIAVVQELERQGGKQALNSLVSKTLIEQEAGKKNVTISKDEIAKEIKKIETNLSQQGQKLDQVLQLQGMTRSSLEDQLKYQLMIDKLVGKDIKVSDKEVADYLTTNKESLPKGLKEDQLKTQVKDQLLREKINEKVQPWLDGLQKNAKINYIVNY